MDSEPVPCHHCGRMFQPRHRALHEPACPGDPPTLARLYEVGRVLPNGECHEWNGHRDFQGYGTLSWNVIPSTLGTKRAHTIALILTTGSRPTGLLALHSCDNPPCINPDHLSWGTVAENVRQSIERGRWAGMKRTSCVHGHELTPENVYSPPGRPNQRRCRTCRKASK
jgi:hypothetical protein